MRDDNAVPEQLGRWRRGAVLGDGGQGRVYEGIGGEGEEKVAIKVILSTREKKRARFTNEVRQQLKLADDGARNIVPLLGHNLGEFEAGSEVGFLVMPLATGTLEKASPMLVGRPALCLEVFEGILTGLQDAHTANLIHRDLKPANILFLDSVLRRPAISDFGLCLLRDTPEDERVTGVDETVGARYYRAPEQEEGVRREVTPAADLYSAGKVLVFMLTGQHIYRERMDGALSKLRVCEGGMFTRLRTDLIEKLVLEDPSKRIQAASEALTVARQIRAGS